MPEIPQDCHFAVYISTSDYMYLHIGITVTSQHVGTINRYNKGIKLNLQFVNLNLSLCKARRMNIPPGFSNCAQLGGRSGFVQSCNLEIQMSPMM